MVVNTLTIATDNNSSSCSSDIATKPDLLISCTDNVPSPLITIIMKINNTDYVDLTIK